MLQKKLKIFWELAQKLSYASYDDGITASLLTINDHGNGIWNGN